MEEMLLRDPSVYPSDEVLKNALGSSYVAFKDLMTRISEPSISITSEWRYYNDGKAWLCKNVHKKKTIFWLSAWEGSFKVTFYFTEKTVAGVDSLDIAKEIKERLNTVNHIGKLIPLTFVISKAEQIMDLMKVVGYKMKC